MLITMQLLIDACQKSERSPPFLLSLRSPAAASAAVDMCSTIAINVACITFSAAVSSRCPENAVSMNNRIAEQTFLFRQRSEALQ